MSTKKVVPMLLAASVMVTGFSGAFVFAPSAFGITSVDELSDIDKSSWAFDALRDLVEKYNVIEGYPDKTFRGDNKATRYEMAAALNAVIRHIGKDIARLGTEKADKEDLAKLAKLQEEFKAELAALQARTDALEARAAKIEAKNEEQDNRLSVLEKLKIYGDVTIGGFADIGSRGGDGSPFPYQGSTRIANYYGSGPGIVNQTAANQGEGFSDSISALGRARINIDYPIVEDADGEGAVGEGILHTRIVGAYGRVSPMISAADTFGVGTGSGLLSGVSRIAADASLFNEGVRLSNLSNGVITGSNARANIYLESAYYQQEFRSGIPILTDLLPGVNLLPDDENWKTSMKMTMGLVPWREVFQKSPYAGDETQQFQNMALVNNAAIPVNVVAPSVVFDWHQGLGKWHSLDVRTALSSVDVSDQMSSLALTYEGSLNYNWGWLADWLDLPGNVYAGGWWMNGRGGSNSLLAYSTGINGTQIASANDLARGLGQDPLNTIASTALQQPFMYSPATGGPLVNQANLDVVAATMGLAAGSLNNTANLAAQFVDANTGLALTPGQLASFNTTQIALTAAQAAATGRIAGQTVTLEQYYQDLLTGGSLPLTVAANLGNYIPYGNEPLGRFDDNDNAYGFYTGFNQEIHRGAGVFFSYAVCDTGPQSVLISALQNGTGSNAALNQTGLLFGVKESMNMGVEIPMKALHLPWREKDVFGIGYAQLKPNDAYGSAYVGTQYNPGLIASPTGIADGINAYATNPNFGRTAGAAQVNNLNNTTVIAPVQTMINRSYMEHIIEAYYKVHVNDRFSITPNVQFIINRLGDPSNDLMTVVGLRSTFKF